MIPVPRLVSLLVLLLAITSPLLGAGRELAPREFGPSAYRASWPAVASAGGKFLTAWREERMGFGTHIVGSFSDGAGRRSSPSFLVVPHANPSWMQLVPRGDGFTLFWAQYFDRTHMVDLDLSGRVLAARLLDLPYHIQRDIAWNGEHFLIAFRHSAAVTNKSEAMMFTRTGEIVRSGIMLDPAMYWADIAVSGNAFLLVTTGFGGLFVQRITREAASTPVEMEAPRFGTQYRPQRPVVVSRGDGSLLVVWSAGDSTRSELKSAIVSAGGALSEARLLLARDARKTILHPLNLAPAGDRYVLALAEYQTTGNAEYLLGSMLLDAAGDVVAQTPEGVRIGFWAPVAASAGPVTVVASTPWESFRQTVMQHTIDGSGNVSAAEAASFMPARQRQPILGAGGGRFVAVWEERTDRPRVRLASLDAFGEPQADRMADGEKQLLEGDLVWNGTEYLFVYVESSNVRAVRLDAGGDAIDREPMSLGGANAYVHTIATTWTGDRWAVAWVDGYRAWLATVSRAGIATPARELDLRSPLPEGWMRWLNSIAIAADGERLLVAWIESQVPNCDLCQGTPTAWVMRFTLGGAPSTRAVKIDSPVNHVALATSGEEYVLLTDSVSATTATLIDDDYGMTFLDSRSFAAGLSDLIWDGDEFVMAQRHRKEWSRHLVVTRFDRTLTLSGPPRGVETMLADEHVPPSIAAVMSGDALVAVSEGDAVQGSKAVVYAERDMDVLPAWPPPRRRAVR